MNMLAIFVVSAKFRPALDNLPESIVSINLINSGTVLVLCIQVNLDDVYILNSALIYLVIYWEYCCRYLDISFTRASRDKTERI